MFTWQKRQQFTWQRNTAGAVEDYTRGVKNPRRSWGKTTCESADRYKAGVDKAHTRGTYRKGVKKKGSRGWQTKTLLKGPTRFAEGVHGAGDNYAKGFKPYHTHFPSIRLPKRFPKGDPRNINRCAVVASEFGMIKEGMSDADDWSCPEL